MRAFIGIEIPEHIREQYFKLCKPLHSSANLSFVRLDKMHITLVFFADLHTSQLNIIDNIMHELIINKLEITCNNIGLFRRKGIPSTIFIKIISDDLKHYTEKLHSKLRDLNIAFDNRRPYIPHITLARIKEMKKEQNFITSYGQIVNKFKPISFMVENIHLYSSDMINYKKEISINISSINNNTILY